jgi:hypothetical protein
MSEWVKRPYIASEDLDALVYLWCTSYLRSREGIARGAYVPHGSAAETNRRAEVREAVMDMWADQEPLVRALLDGSDVMVACDPARPRRTEEGPAVIWAFAATSGDVVHYVCVKRKLAALIGADMVRDLLGSRLDRPCTFTHDLVEMRTGSCGVRLPESWGWDSLFLARMFARQAVGARRAA